MSENAGRDMSIYDKFRAPQYIDFANLVHNDADTSSFFDRDFENDSLASMAKVKTRNTSSSFGETCSDSEKTLTPSAFNSPYADMSIEDTTMDTTDTANKYVGRMPMKGVNTSITNSIMTSINCSAKTVYESPSVEDFSIPNHISTPSTTQCIDIKERHVNKKISYGFQGSVGHKIKSSPKSSRCSGGVKNTEYRSPLHNLDIGNRDEKPSAMDCDMSKESAYPANITSCQRPRVMIIPPTPTSQPPFSTPESRVRSGDDSILRSSRCRVSTSANRRRSRSAGCPKETVMDQEEILQDAIRTLSLSNSKQSPGNAGEIYDQSSSPLNAFSNLLPSIGETKRKPEKEVKGPKRKLSPPPKNTRDYSQQPEKYMSMAESIVHIQKQIPKRFRTLPASSAFKKGVQTKIAKQTSITKDKRSGSSSQVRSVTKDNVDQQKKARVLKEGDNKGVRVPQWPATKVEPFQLVQYQMKSLPKTVFCFDKNREVLLRDRKTPIKRLKNPTKIEPFSFDKRDQEILQRKLNRMKGIEEQPFCCHARRRSKSQGDDVHIKTNVPLVHHARAPTVLHKPPFVPQKFHKVTRPVEIHLKTEKRAKERENFDAYVRQKDDERRAQLEKLEEERKQREEKEILKLRKQLVHKAHPVPVYHRFEVRPSCDRLTKPYSPNLGHRPNISNRTNPANVPDDDSMEG